MMMTGRKCDGRGRVLYGWGGAAGSSKPREGGCGCPGERKTPTRLTSVHMARNAKSKKGQP